MDLTRSTQLYFGVDGHFVKHTLPGMENTQSLWNAVRLLTPVMFPVQYSDGTLPTYGTEDLSSPYSRLNYMGYQERNDNRNMVTLSLTQDFSGALQGLTMSSQVIPYLVSFTSEYRTLNPNLDRKSTRLNSSHVAIS